MDMNTYHQRIIKPINAENAVGVRITDDPLLDFIESQMLKVGSLAHAEVQWDEVEKAAFQLLEEKTKDIKLLSYLLQCLQYQPSAERFTLSMLILADFIQQYWQQCFPAPGNRGNLPRRKYFTQIMQRTEQALRRLDLAILDIEQKRLLEVAFEQLTRAAENENLPTDTINGLKVTLQNAANKPAARAVEKSVTTHTTKSSHSSIVGSRLEIDGSNDRTVKQTLLKVSDFLAERGDSGHLVGLRLRRFAIWFSITSLPDCNNQKETELMPIAIDRVNEYEDELKRGADLALWQRVEYSLTASPFWLDGHYLSYRIAEKLAEPEWASAILQEMISFTQRLPLVIDYRFKGGVPFASNETRQWILNGNQQLPSSSQNVSSNSWHDLYQQLLEVAKKNGINVALTLLNDKLKNAHEKRDQFYLRLLSADLMREMKLNALAKLEYQSLFSDLKEMDVKNWEPSLIQRLERVIQMEEGRN